MIRLPEFEKKPRFGRLLLTSMPLQNRECLNLVLLICRFAPLSEPRYAKCPATPELSTLNGARLLFSMFINAS